MNQNLDMSNRVVMIGYAWYSNIFVFRQKVTFYTYSPSLIAGTHLYCILWSIHGSSIESKFGYVKPSHHEKLYIGGVPLFSY